MSVGSTSSAKEGERARAGSPRLASALERETTHISAVEAGRLTSYPAEDDLIAYYARRLALEDLVGDLQERHGRVKALLSDPLSFGKGLVGSM